MMNCPHEAYPVGRNKVMECSHTYFRILLTSSSCPFRKSFPSASSHLWRMMVFVTRLVQAKSLLVCLCASA
jgi:hypothetical protein